MILGGQLKEIKDKIGRIELENLKLTTEKDHLTRTIQMLNHRLTGLMRQFPNQQVYTCIL